MSYQENIELDDADTFSLLNHFRHGNNRVCFICNEPVTKAVVYHDGFVNGHLLAVDEEEGDDIVNQEKSTLQVMLVIHPKCATVLGQRLIADGYVHRRKD